MARKANGKPRCDPGTWMAQGLQVVLGGQRPTNKEPSTLIDPTLLPLSSVVTLQCYEVLPVSFPLCFFLPT